MVQMLAIVVAQANKLLYVSETGRRGLFTNGCQLGQVHADLAIANYMAQAIDLALKKCTFLHLRI